MIRVVADVAHLVVWYVVFEFTKDVTGAIN